MPSRQWDINLLGSLRKQHWRGVRHLVCGRKFCLIPYFSPETGCELTLKLGLIGSPTGYFPHLWKGR